MIRIGVVGTGYWAEQVHLPVLHASPSMALTGVWGRRPEATAPLAARFGARPFDRFADLLEAVDALSFAVPPDTQANLATEAARAGKHLLLEKPVALASGPALGLADSVRQARVAAVVFFTRVFTQEVEAQIASLAARGPWRHCAAHFHAGALRPGSPYAGSAWRQERGALWDLGPHLLSVLVPLLGDVVDVTARRGDADTVHLGLVHAPGGRSEASLTLCADPAHQGEAYVLDGGAARLEVAQAPRQAAYGAAVRALMAMMGGDRRGEARYGIEIGARVTAILEQAEQRL